MSPKRKEILSISSATFLENLAASRPELLHVLFQAIRNIVIIAFRVTTISQHVGSARLLLLQRYDLLRAARKQPSATRQMTIPEPTCIGP
jgi:hypothetical protein